MKTNNPLADLSERQLLQRFADLVRHDRANTAQLLAHIAEIDERKLWAKHAYPSMFAFCMQRFHMSESMTAKRIWAARTARRFPVILPMVARGELHLSGITRLGKHLTADNHEALLARAKHKSSRAIDVLVAEVAPRPDVPSRIRELPTAIMSVVSVAASAEPASTVLDSNEPCGSNSLPAAGSARGTARHEAELAADSSTPVVGASELEAGSSKPAVAASEFAAGSSKSAGGASELVTNSSKPAVGTSALAADSCDPAVGVSHVAAAAFKPTAVHKQVVALAPRRFKIEITVDQCTHDKLRSLQDLLRHQFPSADPAMIVSRAIEMLLDDTLKKKAAVTEHAHSSGRSGGKPSATTSARRTRAIPAAIRREVWKRDLGRCAFFDEYGKRCKETGCIEYHHEIPFGKGGRHLVENIALRCRTHNRYQAELDYGREFMRSAVR